MVVVSQLEVMFSGRGHLAILEDIFNSHNWGEVPYSHLVGKVKGYVEHLTLYRKAVMTTVM